MAELLGASRYFSAETKKTWALLWGLAFVPPFSGLSYLSYLSYWPLKHLIEIPGRCWFVGRQPTTSHTDCSRRLCTQKALHADKWEGSVSTASVLWSDLCMEIFAEDTDVTEVDGFVWTNWEQLKNWCWIIYICPVGSGTKARSTPVQTFQIPRWASGCSFPTPGPCVGLVAWLGSCVFQRAVGCLRPSPRSKVRSLKSKATRFQQESKSFFGWDIGCCPIFSIFLELVKTKG